jgi:putative hydrolase of the HAD superfamily
VAPLRTLLLDLDDTLYPAGNGLWEAIGVRINEFIIRKIGVSPDEASALRELYFREYGTSLNGLRANHAIDPYEYLAYVHDVPLDAYLAPDPRLRQTLEDLPVQPVIFTNADRGHARRVLARLGVADLVGQIIDIEALGWVNKPEPDAYLRALTLCDETEPEATLVVDDQLRNLAPAAALGMRTVLVGGASPADGPMRWISTVYELPGAILELAGDDER